jgi:hypothetical protein
VECEKRCGDTNDRWSASTSILSKDGVDIQKVEHYAEKEHMMKTIRGLIELSAIALENDQALLFIGD